MEASQKLIANIVSSMQGLNKKRKEFMISFLMLSMGLRGRYNFLNMERYGEYSEKSYRLHFERPFDFLTFNLALLDTDKTGQNRVLAFDPSYIPKSGKKTPHIDKFWSSCLKKAVKGIEISGLAVVDIDNNTALHLESIQTPDMDSLKQKKWTRIDHYADCIISRYEKIKHTADYICVDGFFGKQKFIDQIRSKTHFHLVGKLRRDADLYYLNKTKSSGPGRPAKYDGKVDLKNIDRRRLKKCYQDENVILYEGCVYAKQLKRVIKLCYVQKMIDGQPSEKYQVLFSTDLELEGYLIFSFYKARFQIEFLFRDAKQYTGLNHCEARSENKLHFHQNASLSTVNIAKKTHHLNQPKDHRSAFSMANIKNQYFNQMMLNLFLSNLDIKPELPKIRQLRKKIQELGKIAS